ncbi:cytokine SCM-1 beta-like [Silurus asotus]|uniref:Cytokine SCM-1 beta-like n=1 Tax=Silurus asotus TaxID=30991 RepID=A0AAD5FDC0_SILAS|nr:cytokine SCM-1 beta-like [Silurus asotus]
MRVPIPPFPTSYDHRSPGLPTSLVPYASMLLDTLLMEHSVSAEAMPVSCCLKTCETKVRKEQLKSYTIQDIPLCPVKAVRFILKSGKSLCSDPDSHWTKWAMQMVNEELNQKKEGSQATPMSPLASRWPQASASVPEFVGEHRADSPKPKRRRIKMIKRKRKERKRRRKIPKQPVIDYAPSFTTSSYN